MPVQLPRPGRYSSPLGELCIEHGIDWVRLRVEPLGSTPTMIWVFRLDGTFDHFEIETQQGPGRGVRCAVGCRHISPGYRGRLWLLPPVEAGGLPQLGCDTCVVMGRKVLRADDPRRSIISEDLLPGILARCDVVDGSSE